MTVEEMQKEVRIYCLNLVLNSTIDDWAVNYGDPNYHKHLIYDNIIIELHYKEFRVEIYTDNTHTKRNDTIVFDCYVYLIDTRKKEKTLLKKKYKEIASYFRDKESYESALNTYKLLPIKELRKKKLEKINEDEKSQLDSREELIS